MEVAREAGLTSAVGGWSSALVGQGQSALFCSTLQNVAWHFPAGISRGVPEKDIFWKAANVFPKCASLVSSQCVGQTSY